MVAGLEHLKQFFPRIVYPQEHVDCPVSADCICEEIVYDFHCYCAIG